MGIQVKICGINSSEAAVAAARAGADFVGLVFHPNSPRRLHVDQARALASQLRGKVKLVAVFSDPSDDVLAHTVGLVEPDFIQLHGTETPARLAEIRSRFDVSIIKAISVAEEADLDHVPAYQDTADMFLFDAKPPAGAIRQGGHGTNFDWKILAGRTIPRPWFLAGGLRCENVGRAIHLSGAQAVDASSGVETSTGDKSAQKISEFVAEVRKVFFTSGTAS